VLRNIKVYQRLAGRRAPASVGTDRFCVGSRAGGQRVSVSASFPGGCGLRRAPWPPNERSVLAKRQIHWAARRVPWASVDGWMGVRPKPPYKIWGREGTATEMRSSLFRPSFALTRDTRLIIRFSLEVEMCPFRRPPC